MIYLDHNATSPLRTAALEAMIPWFAAPTNPFSASVAYLTVLHAIVDALRETLSGAGAACTTA